MDSYNNIYNIPIDNSLHNISSQFSTYSNLPQDINNNFSPFNYKKNTKNVSLMQQNSSANYDEVLYNNMPQRLLDESVTDYKITIMSKDRDLDVYPNPYCFTVTFGSISSTTISQEKWIDVNDKSLGKQIVKTTIPSSYAPSIDRSFHNVKYIKFDFIILPIFYRSIYDDASGKYMLDSASSLVQNNKYLLLKIKELMPSSTFLATNNMMNTHAIMFPRSQVSSTHYQYDIIWGKNYNLSNLGNIQKLTFDIYDENGNQIKFQVFNSAMEEEEPDTDINNSGNLNNLHNELLQSTYMLSVGVIENNMQTFVKYEK